MPELSFFSLATLIIITNSKLSWQVNYLFHINLVHLKYLSNNFKINILILHQPSCF